MGSLPVNSGIVVGVETSAAACALRHTQSEGLHHARALQLGQYSEINTLRANRANLVLEKKTDAFFVDKSTLLSRTSSSRREYHRPTGRCNQEKKRIRRLRQVVPAL
jgi:hypothetical protein